MSKRPYRRFGLGLLLTAALSGAAQARTLPPKDECAADASFRSFRAELLKAIDRKDGRYLLSIVAPDIKFSLGIEGDGRAAFIKEWKLDRPARSTVWGELKTILALGCARDGYEMVVPYLFARFPTELEGIEWLVVTKPGAGLYAAPQRTAPVKARLSWEILQLIYEPSGDLEWIHVRILDGPSGYVEAKAVRYLTDYRAIFEKRKGRWMMTYLIAGD